jgi:hypothetical protein
MHHYRACECASHTTTDVSDHDATESTNALIEENSTDHDQFKTRFSPRSLASLQAYYTQITDLSSLLGSPQPHSDVILTTSAKDEDVPLISAHRFILAARSAYFRALFAGGHMLSDANVTHIQLPEEFVPARILPALVSYLYTDHVVFESEPEVTVSLNDWMRLWRAADFLDIASLCDYCLNQIIRSMHYLRCACDACAQQLPTLLLFAERYFLTSLIDGCIHALTHGFYRNWATPGFVNRLTNAHHEMLVARVLEMIQPASVIRILRGCCELDRILVQKKTVLGASNKSATEWIAKVHSFQERIQQHVVQCAKEKFAQFLAQDIDLQDLLLSDDTELLKFLFKLILEPAADEHTKLVVFEHVTALIDAEEERRRKNASAESNAGTSTSQRTITEDRPSAPTPESASRDLTMQVPAGTHKGISDSHMRALYEAVQSCIEYLERRWMGMAAVGSFDMLPTRVIEELALGKHAE